MKLLPLVVAVVLIFTPSPSRADVATLVRAFATYVTTCMQMKTEKEWNDNNCGPGAGGFRLDPKVKKGLLVDHTWRKHCGEIAANYCRTNGLLDDCAQGVKEVHSNTKPGGRYEECYLEVPPSGNWKQHCGGLAKRYCVSANQPHDCQLGIQRTHSGRHPECDQCRDGSC
jgi:hypothetical protein